jgi:aryl-alcohol dehydrogenase-like predicted oxidoreductase
LSAAEPGRTPGSLDDEAESAAIELIRQAITCDIRFLDTSDGGAGRSEGRIARAVAPQGELLDNIVVTTDVNADYSGRRVRTAVRDSMQRLGRNGCRWASSATRSSTRLI